MRSATRAIVGAAAVLLAAAACTATADGDPVPEPDAGIADSASLADVASDDTLPPVIWFEDRDDQQPPGEGPLHPFADSTTSPARWGFRDVSGSVVVGPTLAYAFGMHGGRAAVARADEHGTLRWGYVDARGAVVIEPRYEGASRFSDERAVVMLGDEFLVIDSAGAVVERLADAPGGDTATAQLPAPCEHCALSEYARRLPRVGRPVRINVQPVVGEGFRRVLVQRHPQGVLSIAEGGWEHWAYALRVPGGTMEQAFELARRLMGGPSPRHPDPDVPGAVIIDATPEALARSASGVERMRARVMRGVLEISHSGGS